MLLPVLLLVPGIYLVAYVAFGARALFPRWRRVLLALGGVFLIMAAFEARPSLLPQSQGDEGDYCYDARANNCP